MIPDDKRNMDIVALNEYAAEHYEEVVHGFLAVKGLNWDEYEDVIIPSYLYAVRRYWTHPEIQNVCTFKTCAYMQMYSAVKQYWTYKNRLKRKGIVFSLDVDERMCGYRTSNCCTDYYQRLFERAEAIDLWGRIKPLLTRKEMRSVYLKAMGYSYQEIADADGITFHGVKNRFQKMREKIRILCFD